EDGIRDFHVTGVQTCALPISRSDPPENLRGAPGPFFALLPGVSSWWPRMSAGRAILNGMERNGTLADGFENHLAAIALTLDDARSEERRVGKEWRCADWRVQ